MEKTFFFVVLLAVIAGCDKKDDPAATDSTVTGNQVTYALYSGSDYNISGTVVMEERKDGFTNVKIKLEGGALASSDREFPVHLHPGDVSVNDAPVAALLNPVGSKTGESETVLTQLGDESQITFQQLKALNACIKIHLAAAGEESTIVLAGGNIGTAETTRGDGSKGSFAMAVCGSF